MVTLLRALWYGVETAIVIGHSRWLIWRAEHLAERSVRDRARSLQLSERALAVALRR